MINIGENNQARYKRNRNFSTTIAMELTQTASGEKECIGVVFDVETATNEITRSFFWHKGGLPEHFYRVGGQMSLDLDEPEAEGAASAGAEGRTLSVKKNTGEVRAMSTAELKAWMSRSFAKDECLPPQITNGSAETCTTCIWAAWTWKNSPDCSSAPSPSA